MTQHAHHEFEWVGTNKTFPLGDLSGSTIRTFHTDSQVRLGPADATMSWPLAKDPTLFHFSLGYLLRVTPCEDVTWKIQLTLGVNTTPLVDLLVSEFHCETLKDEEEFPVGIRLTTKASGDKKEKVFEFI